MYPLFRFFRNFNFQVRDLLIELKAQNKISETQKLSKDLFKEVIFGDG